MLARRLNKLPAHTGTRLNERVRAPILDVGARNVRVNGKPLEGIAILDTGAMPLLIGRVGMAQMGWTNKDAVPNAVRLGLANGKSTHMHGLTRNTVKFTFNLGSPTTISIVVRAVVTDAPYDFLVSNIILWTIGATLDAWREELRYRVDWLKGPSLADDREGQVSIMYTRDPGPPILPAAQFCALAWALTTGGEETEEDGSLPDLADGTESEGNSQESKEEADGEGALRTVEVTPVGVSQPWGLLPWEREWAPDATRDYEMGRLVLSSLPSQEYHGPDYEDERVTRHIYALRRRFFADSIELHVFRSTEEVIPPPACKVVARVERDAAGKQPRWAQKAVERHAARIRPGAGLPFGPGRLCEENGLYKGPVLLYRAEQACGFNFTGVAARPGDQPVAPEGYVLLPKQPMVLWGEAAEREVALNRLRPLSPFVPDVLWDELPQAFMAMDTDHWGLLGTSRWVQRGEPRGFSDNLLEAHEEWDRAVAVEPVEGQPKPPLRTKLDGWVTVLCLFAGIGAELEGLLKAGIRVRKLLVVEIDPVARRILEFCVWALHRRYPDQLPAVACEGLLTALPADIRLVGSQELRRYMPIHIVTVSSPCQGLSRANRDGRGLADPRSELISNAKRILGYLSKNQTLKPAYTFEMVDARDHPSQDARDGFTIIDRVAGGAVDTAVIIDAAKLGSAAHRVRAFWTNAAPSRTLKQRYAQFDREWVQDRKEAQNILHNGRRVNIAQADDPDIRGFYRMNFKGEPIRVFPTLVSMPQSFAFRLHNDHQTPGQEMVYDPELRGRMEATADERERIMGMEPGSTRAPGVTEDQRRAAIGNAIDVRAYRWLWREIRRWRALHYDEDLA
jgi:site-specific DNA-cytosine methylase